MDFLFFNLNFITTKTLTTDKQMACQPKWFWHIKPAFTLLVRCFIPIQNTSFSNERKSEEHLLPFSLNFKGISKVNTFKDLYSISLAIFFFFAHNGV